ncbi:MAG TPA: hypothetical protein VGK78_07725 [Nocardioides sp.]|uniref:DUF4386 family protein n=1 Tax=Nocardioides sp. TaxID=35761 RepID=UPI002F400068
MSTTSTSIDTPAALGDHTAWPTVWRVAGGLALAHVVMLFAAITQEVMVSHDTSLEKLQDSYADANLTRVFTGGYIEAVSFVVLAAAVVVVARIFRRGSEGARLSSDTFLALGVTFVAATLAVGFAPGAAAMYGAQHGADIHAVAVVNDIRNYGYQLQVMIQGAMAIALGLAALLGGLMKRWVGWGGIVIGAATLVGTPFANNGLGMLWYIWWVGVAVLLLTGRGLEQTRK